MSVVQEMVTPRVRGTHNAKREESEFPLINQLTLLTEAKTRKTTKQTKPVQHRNPMGLLLMKVSQKVMMQICMSPPLMLTPYMWLTMTIT